MDAGTLVVGGQRRLQLVGGQHVGVRVHDPAGMRRTQRQPVPLVATLAEPIEPTLEVAARDPAQHGIGEAADPLPHRRRGQVDGRGDGRVRRDPHRQDLVRAEPQQVQQRGLQLADRPVRGGGEDGVVGAHPATRAGQELGGERGVARGEFALAKQPGEREIGVRAVGAHLAQGVVGEPAGAIGRGSATPAPRVAGAPLSRQVRAGRRSSPPGPSPRRASASCPGPGPRPVPGRGSPCPPGRSAW